MKPSWRFSWWIPKVDVYADDRSWQYVTMTWGICWDLNDKGSVNHWLPCSPWVIHLTCRFYPQSIFVARINMCRLHYEAIDTRIRWFRYFRSLLFCSIWVIGNPRSPAVEKQSASRKPYHLFTCFTELFFQFQWQRECKVIKAIT